MVLPNEVAHERHILLQLGSRFRARKSRLRLLLQLLLRPLRYPLPSNLLRSNFNVRRQLYPSLANIRRIIMRRPKLPRMCLATLKTRGNGT